MNKIIILLLISFSSQAQFIPSIIGSVNYDRKVRKIEPAKVPEFGFGGFTINHTGIETAAMGDLRAILEPYAQQGKIINIQKEPLGLRTGQAFYISANSTTVVLKYTTSHSLDNAIYSYLELIGMNWYGPGANWFIKKAILNVPMIAGEWVEPTFRNRTFSGTGGLDFPVSVDPTNEFKKNWFAFKRRNRYNGDFSVPSHSGQAFYVENKALSDANPQWFFNEAGKANGRIRVEIPAAIQAYKDWFLRNPNLIDSFISINADPEDGRGNQPEDPLPPDGFLGINNWNASDKWWYFANEVAKAYDSNSTRTKIVSLSYGDGSTVTLVPKFPLKKNVYPWIAPYAFQTAYLPNQMVKTWNANTVGNMGMYDYWNITQWSLGLPGFNIYDIPTKLRFWSKNTVDALFLETTDAAGPTGHMFWLAGQMQFDTTKNFDTLYKKYLVDCFGKGWQPMKRMFDRWSLNYQFNSDVNFSLKDLKDATDSIAVNSPEWKRLADLKAYVGFMKLMSERNGTQIKNNVVYQYMYSIHSRMMVHTTGMTGQSYLGPPPVALSAHQLTDAEVETNFNADLAALPVEYALSNFVFDYDKATYIDSIPLFAWSRGFFASAQFKAKTTGTVSIDMGAGLQTQGKIYTEDSVYINEPVGTGNFTFTETLYLNAVWSMKNYQIPVVAGQIFNVGTRPSGLGRVRMRTPGIILFFINYPDDFDNSLYPIKYFYVPIGTTKIAYRDDLPQPFNGANLGYLVPPGGTGLVRTATTAANIYTVNVPAGQDGKVWKASFGHSSWNFVNIPNISTLQFFSYTENP